jgi:hypothetical protein
VKTLKKPTRNIRFCTRNDFEEINQNLELSFNNINNTCQLLSLNFMIKHIAASPGNLALG